MTAPEAPPRDPARGLRGIGAAILCTHAITVGLAVPVVATREGAGGSGAAIAVLAAIAGLDLLAVATLRRVEQFALLLGSALQVATIAAGVLSGFLYVLGVLFGGLWVGWLAMRRSVRAAGRHPAPPGRSAR